MTLEKITISLNDVLPTAQLSGQRANILVKQIAIHLDLKTGLGALIALMKKPLPLHFDINWEKVV